MALQSGDGVSVTRGDGYWKFRKATRDTDTAASNNPSTGLVFFSGALVEPAAYAPLLRAIASRGYTVLLIALPRRGALGGANGETVLNRAQAAMRGTDGVERWVIGGHSRGGAVAARFVHERASAASGLVLIGTSHPRDFDLSRLTIPVTKVLGTRDHVSRPDKSYANRPYLPGSIRWILIEGGNHSQFGYYGSQPGDLQATISREEQQRETFAALIDALQSVDPVRRAGTSPGSRASSGRPGGSEQFRNRLRNIRAFLAEVDGSLRISDAASWSHEASAALHVVGQIRFEVAELQRAGLKVDQLESSLHELESHLQEPDRDTWSQNVGAAKQAVGNLRLELQSLERAL